MSLKLWDTCGGAGQGGVVLPAVPISPACPRRTAWPPAAVSLPVAHTRHQVRVRLLADPSPRVSVQALVTEFFHWVITRGFCSEVHGAGEHR